MKQPYMFFILLIFGVNSSYSNNEIEKDVWKGVIPAKNIVINNQYGDVRMRYGGDKDVLEYIVVTQHLEKDGSIYVEKSENDNAIYISTGRKGTKLNNKSKDDARIDITLFIPKNKIVHVQTADGKIDAKGLRSDLNIITEKGHISIAKHHGLLNTKSNTGKTTIVLINHDYEKPQKFESIYGPISVTVSNKSNLHVKMSSSSNIISDFSLEMIKHRNSEPNKTAIIKINKASSELVLKTKRGDLALKEFVEF